MTDQIEELREKVLARPAKKRCEEGRLLRVDRPGAN